MYTLRNSFLLPEGPNVWTLGTSIKVHLVILETTTTKF